MSPINNRYDIALIFDCQDGNPNGDPDAGNMPRVDPQTLHGLVSDVCQKRKVRDWIYLSQLADNGSPKTGYDIFFGHAGIPDRQLLNEQIDEAHLSLVSDEQRAEYDAAPEKDRATMLKKFAKANVNDAQAYLCRTRFDIRTFGAVLSTGANAGQVRGPVQCTFARSADPVLALEATITRKAVATHADAQKQLDKEGSITGTMGRKSLIPYGLYRSSWFVNPLLARQTGFNDEDLKLLLQALLAMWELDRSASRGLMATRSLVVFKHANALGNARAHELLQRVSVSRASDGPARTFSDYTVRVDTEGLPAGVEFFDLTNPTDFERLFPA